MKSSKRLSKKFKLLSKYQSSRMCMSRRPITNRQLRAKVSSYPLKRNLWSMFLQAEKRVFMSQLAMASLLTNKNPHPSGLLIQDTFPLPPAKVRQLPNPFNNLPNNITSPKTCVSTRFLRTKCLSTRLQFLNFGRRSLKRIKIQVMQALSQLMLWRITSIMILGPMLWLILTPRLDRYSPHPLLNIAIQIIILISPL